MSASAVTTVLKERGDTWINVKLTCNPLRVIVAQDSELHVLEPKSGKEALDMFEHPFAYIRREMH